MRDVFAEYDLTRGELARTEELIDKLENEKITVSAIGQFKRGKTYDPDWNMLKLTRRGKFPADGADTLNESVVMESHLRHFCIFIR